MKLGQVFDPRKNALNAFRLALAASVIVHHSFPLTGRSELYAPAHRLLSDLGVDGFFAISGFLITSSWLSRPQLRNYFAARGLRIFPGLWVCLAITAFIIAPVSVAIQHGRAANLLMSRGPIQYILEGGTVLLLHPDVGGTPRAVPFPGVWNGSLWTLQWELLCYIAVAGFGVVGLLNRRWFIPAALTLALCLSALLPSVVDPDQNTPPVLFYETAAARFAVMFWAGALLYQFRNAIPARWSLVGVSVVAIMVASLLPNYRLLGGIPLAYAIIVSGALIRNKRLRLKTDLSYGVYIYAFPIQQLLVISGLISLNPILFSIVAAATTVPLAALSWFLVEKPAMSLKSRLKQRSVAPAAEPGLVASG